MSGARHRNCGSGWYVKGTSAACAGVSGARAGRTFTGSVGFGSSGGGDVPAGDRCDGDGGGGWRNGRSRHASEGWSIVGGRGWCNGKAAEVSVADGLAWDGARFGSFAGAESGLLTGAKPDLLAGAESASLAVAESGRSAGALVDFGCLLSYSERRSHNRERFNMPSMDGPGPDDMTRDSLGTNAT